MNTRILVVDDSPVERRLVSGLLERGLTDVLVAHADNGRQALDVVANEMPDCIVTDLQMPEMNGLELVEAIRNHGYAVPVILMTSYGNEEVAVRALRTGAASYVPKRALGNQLIETVTSVLSVSHRQLYRRRILNTLDAVESRFILENDTSLICPLIAYLQEQLETMRLFDDLQTTRIGIALHEALTNAIYHGNLELDSELRQGDEFTFYHLAVARRNEARYQDRRVRLSAQLSATEARFIVRDDGSGYQPSEVRNCTDEVNLDRIGGRGLLLIRSFMDQVSHNPQGNEISMVKFVPRTPSADA